MSSYSIDNGCASYARVKAQPPLFGDLEPILVWLAMPEALSRPDSGPASCVQAKALCGAGFLAGKQLWSSQSRRPRRLAEAVCGELEIELCIFFSKFVVEKDVPCMSRPTLGDDRSAHLPGLCWQRSKA